jgi:hypothetical protein
LRQSISPLSSGLEAIRAIFPSEIFARPNAMRRGNLGFEGLVEFESDAGLACEFSRPAANLTGTGGELDS